MLAVGLLVNALAGTACAREKSPQAQSNFIPAQDKLEYYNPEVPEQVTIAGELVDLDREDLRERLDRELTSMAYNHSTTMLVLKRANKYFPLIAPILKKNGIPDDFVYLAAIESSLTYRAYSPKKAAGMWQFIAQTGKEFGLEVGEEVDERYDPEKSTVAACKYLKKAYAKFGSWTAVAASYNAGMTGISKMMDNQLVDNYFDLYLTEETSRYVFRMIAMKMMLENPRKYGFILTPEQLYQPVDYTTETVSGPVESWAKWAKERGVTYSQLREMNPWIRSTKLTNKAGKTYTVKIPVQSQLYRSKREIKVYNQNWVSD